MQINVNPEDIADEVLEAVKAVAARAFCPPADAHDEDYELAMQIAKVTSFDDHVVDDDTLGFKATVMIDGRQLIVSVEDGGQL